MLLLVWALVVEARFEDKRQSQVSSGLPDRPGGAPSERDSVSAGRGVPRILLRGCPQNLWVHPLGRAPRRVDRSVLALTCAI
jgi:hypothetical protein